MTLKLSFVVFAILLASSQIKAQSGGSTNYGTYSSSSDSASKAITFIGPEENVSIPSQWSEGKEIYTSIEGGMAVRLLLEGFTQSVVNQVASISFKPFGKNKDTAIYEKPLDNQDLLLTGSGMDKLIFLTPSLSTIRGKSFHSKSTWHFEYLVELRLNDGTQVPCSTQNECRIIFSYGYTQVISYLSNVAAIANQNIEYRIIRNNALELQKDGMSLKAISVYHESKAQNCDYTGKIDATSSVSKYGVRQYSCAFKGVDFYSQAEFKQIDHAGVASLLDQTKIYEYDGSSFQLRILPSITSVSSSQGQGGLSLTITGTSFKPGSTTFKIGDKVCVIESEPVYRANTQDYEAKCTTPAKSEVQTKTIYAGNHGFWQQSWLDVENILAAQLVATQRAPDSRNLILNAESPYNNELYQNKKVISKFETFFKAPKSSEYRFWLTASKDVRIYMNPARPNQILDRDTEMTLILENKEPNKLRDLYGLYNDETKKFEGTSDWILMQEGDFYHMELWFDNGYSEEHFTLGVEIKHEVAMANSRFQIQRIRYAHLPQYPGFYFKLDWDSIRNSQRFNLVFDYYLARTGHTPYTITDLKVGMDANTLETHISTYLKKQFGTNAVYKINRKEVINKIEHYIEIIIEFEPGTYGEVLNQPSIVRLDNADVSRCESVYYRGTGQVTGKQWKLKVFDPETQSYKFINNIPQDVPDWRLADRISSVAPFYHQKVQVDRHEVTKHGVFVGYQYVMTFWGIRSLVIPFEAININIPNAEFQSETLLDSSNNIFLYPAPYSLFYNVEKTPQITVEVDGYLGACNWPVNHQKGCSFEYVAPQPVIYSYMASADKKMLTITGDNFDQLNYQYIRWAGFQATTLELTKTKIVVKVDKIEAGSHAPQIYVEGVGFIPFPPNFPKILIQAQIIDHTKEVYQTGGQTIWLTANSLPASIDKVQMKIGESVCTDVRRSSSLANTIECTMPKIATPGEYDLTLSCDGVDTVSTQKINVKFIAVSVTTPITSMKASEKRNVDVTVTGINQDLCNQMGNFRIFLKHTEGSIKVNMKPSTCVYDAGATSHSFVVHFPGGTVGVYQLNVFHTVYGLIVFESSTIRLGPTIFSITPTEGSLYGGTLLTITGKNFESENIFKFQNSFCTVQSLNSTTVECLTPQSVSLNSQSVPINGDGVLYVQHSDSSFTLCGEGVNCKFSWKDTLTPSVTGLTVNSGSLSILGESFPTDINQIEVRVGGAVQPSITLPAANQIQCVLSELTSWKKDLEVQVRIINKGYCKMASSTDKISPQTFKFTGLSQTVASEGGSSLKVSGEYFSLDADLALITQTGKVICQKLIYSKINEMECLTLPGVYAQETVVLKNNENAATINCEGSSCTYETSSAITSTISSVAVQGSVGSLQVFTLTGTNFQAGNAEVIIANKKATTVTVVSTTEVRAEFQSGVGFVKNEKPVLIFASGNIAAVDNSVSISISIENAQGGSVVTSLNGGRDYQYVGTGIGTDRDVSVKVCGYPCHRVFEREYANKLVCELPPIHSIYSVRNDPAIEESVSLYTEENVFAYTSDLSLAPKVFDGVYTTSFGESANCYVGIQTLDNERMYVEEIKFYLSSNADKSKYNGGKFVGSDDGVLWTTLFEITETPLTGWNTADTDCSLLPFNSYRYVKWEPSTKDLTACDFAELQFHGKLMYNKDTIEFNCPAQLFNKAGTTIATHSDAVAYSYQQTPKVASVSNRHISWKGNEALDIFGSGFGSHPDNVKVNIDGIACGVTAAIQNRIQCTTGERRNPVTPSTFEVIVADKGRATTNGVALKYVCYFSDNDCWGSDYAPGPGDTMHIPAGFNLVIDVDQVPSMEGASFDDPPYLDAVVVEGSLIFQTKPGDDQHKRTFSAKHIVVREGELEIGTETDPYTSQLEIVLYGDKEDPQLPQFGNKAIGVWQGSLNMHGKKRTHSWVELKNTAEAQSSEVILNVLAAECDWNIGDEIAIASTQFDADQAEKFTITGQSATTDGYLKLQLNAPLAYKHYAGEYNYGSAEVPDIMRMRAEVGLLSRNIKIRGDQTSASSLYGGHIMLKGHKVHAKISNVEFKQMGQAYQVQRHPVSFTESEQLISSYVSHSSIWNGYNRAIGIHATNCVKISHNVAFNVMGHNFFLQDGVETLNKFVSNLAINTVPSHSLQNTDQTPASFWITNPNNEFEGNRAAGSYMYGFWLDLPENPTGSSSTNDLCPVGMKLGSFKDNEAHSNGRYGIRIFPQHIPRTFPCGEVYEQPSLDQGDPQEQAFSSNPPIPALYENIVVYKNKRAGLIAEKIGALTFKNVKTADNIEDGIEITLPGFAKLDQGVLENALIIGFSENNESIVNYTTTKGITTGQRDSFEFKNIRFYNFTSDQTNTEIAAIGTCSHCTASLDEDGRANTYTFRGLSFVNVTYKLKYNTEKNTIIHNPDGSILGDGRDVYMTGSQPHFYSSSNVCAKNADLDTSTVCSKPIRKLKIHSVQPSLMLEGKTLKIVHQQNIPSDDIFTEEVLAKYTHLSPSSGGSRLWVVPFVIGETYNLHWHYGLEFTQMGIKRSRMFTPTEESFVVMFNHTDRRDAYQVTGRNVISNVTSETALQSSNIFGVHYHDLSKSVWKILVNGKPEDAGLGLDSTLLIEIKRCANGCTPIAEDGVIEDRIRYWSVATDWDIPAAGIVGKVPVHGDAVTIGKGWNMFYDIPTQDSVQLKSLEVLGRLTFNTTLIDNTPTTFELKSHLIIIEKGEIIIGNTTNPYENHAIITLLGEANSPHFSYSNSLAAGNKLLFVTGSFIAVGKDFLNGGKYTSRLYQSCEVGEQTIRLEPGLGWGQGMKIALAPSGYDSYKYEDVTLASYDNTTGYANLNSPIKYPHYGALYSDKDGDMEYDLRSEVGLLSRNIIVQGSLGSTWGGQIFVTEWTNLNTAVVYAGRMILKNVELRRLGQYDALKAAIRIRNIQRHEVKIIQCSLHHTQGQGVLMADSRNIQFSQNVLYRTFRNALMVRATNDLEIMDNLFIANTVKLGLSSSRDFQVAVDICVGERISICKNLIIQRNIVAGGVGIAYTAPAADCSSQEAMETSGSTFSNNAAHSVGAGLIAHINNAIEQPQCALVQNFTAHHSLQIGVQSKFFFTNVMARNLILVDNQVSLELGLTNGDNPNGNVTFSDSLVVGEHVDTIDCKHSFEKDGTRKIGMFTGVAYTTYLELPYTYPAVGFHTVGQSAPRGKEMVIQRVKFKDFTSRYCGIGNIPQLINLHPESSDLVMKHIFRDISIDNVNNANFLYLSDPDPSWATFQKCGEFTCTGPQNVLMAFEGALTQSNNIPIAFPSTPFTIIPNNKDVVDSSCTIQTAWNAYSCASKNWALLEFESLDSDSFDRSVQPIYITSDDNSSFNNKLNSFMNHVKESFYVGQKRMSRFVSLLRTNEPGFFNVSYTGTPPKQQLFGVYGASQSDYVKLRIDFTDPQAMRVYLNGNLKEQNALVDGVMKPLQGDVCGENRWDPINAILEFTLQGGDGLCEVEIKALQSIQLTMRMDLTLQDFYSNNGELDFMEKLSQQLGIPINRIKVVGIRSGSVVIESEILNNDSLYDINAQASELEILSISLQDKLNGGEFNTTAPLLDYQIVLSIFRQKEEPQVVPTPQQPTQSKKSSLIWPITIMVSGVCLLTAAVLILIILIKRLRLNSSMTRIHDEKAAATCDMISKGLCKESGSVIEIPIKDAPSSDRLLRMNRRPTITHKVMAEQIKNL